MRSKTTVAAIVLSLLPFFPAHVLAQKMRVGYWTSGFSLGFGAVMEQMRFAENQGLSIDWVKFAEVNGPTRAIVSKRNRCRLCRAFDKLDGYCGRWRAGQNRARDANRGGANRGAGRVAH
jgi:hypothetical protein